MNESKQSPSSVDVLARYNKKAANKIYASSAILASNTPDVTVSTLFAFMLLVYVVLQ